MNHAGWVAPLPEQAQPTASTARCRQAKGGSPAALLAMVLLLGHVSALAATVNNDSRYRTWNRSPDEAVVRIPIYIESARYANDSAGLLMIQNAITALNAELSGCIQLYVVGSPISVGRDFVWVSPEVNGMASMTCQSAPGRSPTQNGNGQKMILVGGNFPGSCLGELRSAVAMFVGVLGLRNEADRPDRDGFITVNITNLDPRLASYSSMYMAYSMATVTLVGPLDSCSIMMPKPTDFAKPGSQMFTLKGTSGFVTQDAHLSRTDLTAIRNLYGCPAGPLPPDDCATRARTP